MAKKPEEEDEKQTQNKTKTQRNEKKNHKTQTCKTIKQQQPLKNKEPVVKGKRTKEEGGSGNEEEN